MSELYLLRSVAASIRTVGRIGARMDLHCPELTSAHRTSIGAAPRTPQGEDATGARWSHQALIKEDASPQNRLAIVGMHLYSHVRHRLRARIVALPPHCRRTALPSKRRN